jgi:Rps23 Pro-64 3,4-dihydroxylase Tpa1-like proline 4-hydroxylase
MLESNIEYDGFIGIYRNVFPAGLCQHLIDQFNYWETRGCVATRQQLEDIRAHQKNDSLVFMTNDWIDDFVDTKTQIHHHSRDVVYSELQNCLSHYSNKFSVLLPQSVTGRTIKLQRTSPGGGYHVWHCEQNSGDQSSRVLSWMVYLNTLEPEEAGETEFLYQQKRYRPIENTLIIWPASYTHTHRGNTVFGDKDKYIATGWFYLNS